jgi:hypothetical protein
MKPLATTLLCAGFLGLLATLPAAASDEAERPAFEVSEVTGEVLPLVEAPLPPIRREAYALLSTPSPAIVRRPVLRARLASHPRATGVFLRCAVMTCPHLMLLGTAF